MKYYRQWKEANAVFEEISFEEAFKIMKSNYNGDDAIKDMLQCEQIIPCMFCTIKVEA